MIFSFDEGQLTPLSTFQPSSNTEPSLPHSTSHFHVHAAPEYAWPVAGGVARCLGLFLSTSISNSLLTLESVSRLLGFLSFGVMLLLLEVERGLFFFGSIGLPVFRTTMLPRCLLCLLRLWTLGNLSWQSEHRKLTEFN